MIKASREVIQYFEKVGNIRHFKKDDLVYMQGDTSPNIYLIAQGRVRMFFIGNDGKEITYQIIGEGQLIGESAFLGYAARPTTIRAVNDVTLISCPVKRLQPFLQQSRELTEVLLALLTDNYNFLCSQVRRLTVYDRFQRVASYLLDQTAQDNRGMGIKDNILPYTHEELGVCLNLNRVTVTKVLNEFQQRNLVKLGRKKIQVVDKAGLEAIIGKESHIGEKEAHI